MQNEFMGKSEKSGPQPPDSAFTREDFAGPLSIFITGNGKKDTPYMPVHAIEVAKVIDSLEAISGQVPKTKLYFVFTGARIYYLHGNTVGVDDDDRERSEWLLSIAQEAIDARKRKTEEIIAKRNSSPLTRLRNFLKRKEAK